MRSSRAGCGNSRPCGWRRSAEVREREAAGELLVGPEVTRWFPNGGWYFRGAARLGERALTRSDFVAGEKLEPIYLRETTFVKAPPPRAISLPA